MGRREEEGGIKPGRKEGESEVEEERGMFERRRL